ncbi:hypothetical protein D3C87_1691570 [compost metagenome]
MDGGATPYLQQQNFSLSALSKRDAQADPFATAQPAAEPAVIAEPTDEEIQDSAKMLALLIEKRLANEPA